MESSTARKPKKEPRRTLVITRDFYEDSFCCCSSSRKHMRKLFAGMTGFFAALLWSTSARAGRHDTEACRGAAQTRGCDLPSRQIWGSEACVSWRIMRGYMPFRHHYSSVCRLCMAPTPYPSSTAQNKRRRDVSNVGLYKSPLL